MRKAYRSFSWGISVIWSLRGRLPRMVSISAFDWRLILTQFEEGRIFAKRYGCGFIETSAMLRINVDEAFTKLVREIKYTKVRPSLSPHPCNPPLQPQQRFGQSALPPQHKTHLQIHRAQRDHPSLVRGSAGGGRSWRCGSRCIIGHADGYGRPFFFARLHDPLM
jgi:hypothetical protein